jgi:hypothetical protein
VSTPPQPGFPLAYLFAVLAAVLAFLVSRERAEHRPVALFLGAMAAIDIGRAVLARVVDFDAAPRPHVGAVRLAFHADEIGFIAWPFALAALALVVFGGWRRPWPVLALWALACVALVALYPSPLVRQEGLQRIYLGAHLAALAVYVATLASWGAKRLKPDSEHAALLILGAVDLARLIPFHGSVFAQWGAFMPTGNAVLYALLAAVQGGFLWNRSRSS